MTTGRINQIAVLMHARVRTKTTLSNSAGSLFPNAGFVPKPLPDSDREPECSTRSPRHRLSQPGQDWSGPVTSRHTTNHSRSRLSISWLPNCWKPQPPGPTPLSQATYISSAGGLPDRCFSLATVLQTAALPPFHLEAPYILCAVKSENAKAHS